MTKRKEDTTDPNFGKKETDFTVSKSNSTTITIVVFGVIVIGVSLLVFIIK